MIQPFEPKAVRRAPAPLHDVATIETPERIIIDLPLAGVATRAIAYLIDMMWQLVPLLLLGIVVFSLLPPEVKPAEFFSKDQEGQLQIPLGALAFMSIVVFFVNFAYYVVFELLWKGQSPGKRAVGIRVVRDGGLPIDGRAALIRNLLRSLDILPGSYMVGMICLLLGRQGKRVGDYAAGTLVIKEAALEPPLLAEAPRAADAVDPLTLAEREVVNEFLARRVHFSETARAELARQLAERLSQRLGRPAPPDAETFLERL